MAKMPDHGSDTEKPDAESVAEEVMEKYRKALGYLAGQPVEPDFQKKIEVAREIMKENRDVLRKLGGS